MGGTALLVVFLVAHGLVHLAVWWPPEPEPAEKPPPFHPDHSALLTHTRAPATTTRQLSKVLAGVTAAAYVVAALGVATGAAWAAPAAVTAAAVGLVLKALYFHPWLSLGVVLDLLVLTSALAGWPVALG